MDFEEFVGKLMENRRNTPNRNASNRNAFNRNAFIGNSANAIHEVQYPIDFKNSAITLQATPFIKEAITTIVIATQCQEYDEQNFNRDVKSTCQFFNLQHDQIIKVLLKPITMEDRVLDAKNATELMLNVVNKLNESYNSKHITSDLKYIRIISLGVATSNFIFKALEYLLNKWEDPNKCVQFVCNGEIEGDKFLQFWKDAVISHLCAELQYTRLDEYLPFGYYSSNCRKFMT